MSPVFEIVATLGPSSRGLASPLRDAGATALRLNASHMSVQEFGALAAETRLACQVMEHLTLHQEPTRTEVCHLFDLVSRGYAGFVLSDGTAIGEDPVRAVHATRSLLERFSGGNRA
jgi:pyruvate kinase